MSDLANKEYWGGEPLNMRVVCADGFTVSIQADEYKYCYPRTSFAPEYSEVELGFPSQADDLITPYAEMMYDEDDEPARRLTDTVYPYTPARVVIDLLLKHGGVVSGELPRLVGLDPLEVLADDQLLSIWQHQRQRGYTDGGE